MKAIWNDTTIAESDDTIEIEGNQYFPPESVKKEFLQPSATHSTCPWKGEASYYNVAIEGEVNPDAAWYYPVPKDGSIDKVGQDFTNYVAFWHGIKVTA